MDFFLSVWLLLKASASDFECLTEKITFKFVFPVSLCNVPPPCMEASCLEVKVSQSLGLPLMLAGLLT